MYNSCAAFVVCSILSYTLEKFLSICTRTKGCQCHLKASIARCGGGIEGAKVTVKVTRQQRGQLQLPLIDASAARSIELIGRHFKGRKTSATGCGICMSQRSSLPSVLHAACHMPRRICFPNRHEWQDGGNGANGGTGVGWLSHRLNAFIKTQKRTASASVAVAAKNATHLVDDLLPRATKRARVAESASTSARERGRLYIYTYSPLPSSFTLLQPLPSAGVH